MHSVLAVHLDLVQTLAVASLAYLAGTFVKKRVGFIDRLNIPSAVIGGLGCSLVLLALRGGVLHASFDLSAQPLFMVMFFTTIGMGASVNVLKSGGLPMVMLLAIASVLALLQNGLGVAVAGTLGVHPLLGVIGGSLTLVGGPATGLAFANEFSKAGIEGADTVAITAATFGIICAGLIGGPVATWLMTRNGLTGPSTRHAELVGSNSFEVKPHEEKSPLVTNLIVASVVMGIGSLVSLFIESLAVTLPAYIGAMVIASLVRNIDDRKKWFKIDQRMMEFIGNISLNIFLIVALMNLRIWELLALAVPLFVILFLQVAMTVIFSMTVCYRLMGRDYDGAVIVGGFLGFALGITANALANMRTLTSRFGTSPRAFLVVPIVGAFFIDFTNALIISLFLNFYT